MDLIISFIAGAVFGAIVVYLGVKPRLVITKEVGGELLNELIKQKRKNLAKLEALLKRKGKITNDDVEKFLKVSNATAERYLDELEKAGKIKQIGRTGKYTHYQQI